MLADPPDGDPELILIATGSEVALAVEAYEELIGDGIGARDRQPALVRALRPAESEQYRDERPAPRR